MNKPLLIIGTALLLTSSAFAQETVTGTVGGAAIGAIVAGPPGALVGAAVGGTAGAASESARYKYSGEVRTGVVLPASGVSYTPVPDKLYVSSVPANRRNYVYTVIDDAGPNDRYVIVDPSTHAVVQVVQ